MGSRGLFWTVMLVLWGLTTHGSFAGSGDEPHYLTASYSLAFDGDLTCRTTIRARAPIYIAAIAVPMVNPYEWTGGWSPAARFLVPITPLLAGAIYQAVISAPVPALMLAGLQVALSALVWQRPKLLWSEGDGTAALCAAGDWLPQCWLFPSMIRGGSSDWSVALGALAMATAWGVWIRS